MIKGYITVKEASKLCQVEMKTIRNWLKARRIKGKFIPYGNSGKRKRIVILKKSIPKDLIKHNTRCLLCKKKLKGTKHISRRKYCGPQHAALWHYYNNKG